MRRIIVAIAALSASAAPSHHVGDAWLLTRDVETTERTDTGGTSSTTDRDALVERIAAVRPDGVEFTYDLPADADARERAFTWQLPLRVFRPTIGAPQLLDRAAMVARVDAWLKTAGLTRTACGRLIFTWNAFRIECEPETALAGVAAFRIEPTRPEAGAPYRDRLATGSVPLARTGPFTLAATLPVDPAIVRRERAQADSALGELTEKAVTPEAADRRWATIDVSGTVRVTFTVDQHGDAVREVREATVTTRPPTGGSEIRTEIETLTRGPAG
jgi:hypothetical protein